MDWQNMIVLITIATAGWLWLRQMFGAKASGCGSCPQSCGGNGDGPALTELELGPNRVDK